MPTLKEFSSELKYLTVLEDFEIANCPSLQSIWSMPVQTEHLPATLKILNISGCPKLQFLPREWIESSFMSLEQLRIREACDTLNDLSLGLISKIRDLEIQDCKSIELLSTEQGNGNLASLHSLSIWGCENLGSFLQGRLTAANLCWIMLYGCKKLKSLPERMRTVLPSLRFLHIWSCPEIECFSQEGLPFSLETLEISDCEKLMKGRREWNLQTLPCLGELIIGSTQEELFLGDWLLPLTLRVLRISWHCNLEAFNYRSLQQLIFLESLCIRACHQLQSLPEEGLPDSLSELVIYDCPLLKPRLDYEKGEDWCKVAHISCLMVDGELVP